MQGISSTRKEKKPIYPACKLLLPSPISPFSLLFGLFRLHPRPSLEERRIWPAISLWPYPWPNRLAEVESAIAHTSYSSLSCPGCYILLARMDIMFISGRQELSIMSVQVHVQVPAQSTEYH